jgi:hypothetical protein
MPSVRGTTHEPVHQRQTPAPAPWSSIGTVQALQTPLMAYPANHWGASQSLADTQPVARGQALRRSWAQPVSRGQAARRSRVIHAGTHSAARACAPETPEDSAGLCWPSLARPTPDCLPATVTEVRLSGGVRFASPILLMHVWGLGPRTHAAPRTVRNLRRPHLDRLVPRAVEFSARIGVAPTRATVTPATAGRTGAALPIV